MVEHRHFDEQAVAKAAAAVRAMFAERLELEGSAGAQARFNYAVIEQFHLQVAAECNRGTEAAHIADGVCAVIANMIQTIACSTTSTDGEQDRIKQVAAINAMLLRISTFCSQTAGNFAGTIIRPTPGGRA